jgi:hypothetical protein
MEDAMTNRRRRGALLVLVTVTVLTAAQIAYAQKRKIVLDEEFVVEGNIPKPEALFILPRKALNFAELERREDLRKKIIEAVETAPF